MHIQACSPCHLPPFPTLATGLLLQHFVLDPAAGKLPSSPIDIQKLVIPRAQVKWPTWSSPLVVSVSGMRLEVLQKQAPLVSSGQHVVGACVLAGGQLQGCANGLLGGRALLSAHSLVSAVRAHSSMHGPTVSAPSLLGASAGTSCKPSPPLVGWLVGYLVGHEPHPEHREDPGCDVGQGGLGKPGSTVLSNPHPCGACWLNHGSLHRARQPLPRSTRTSCSAWSSCCGRDTPASPGAARGSQRSSCAQASPLRCGASSSMYRTAAGSTRSRARQGHGTWARQHS